MAAALPGAFGERAAAVRGELRRAAGRSQRRGRARCSTATTGCATCSSGSSSGAPRPACCGWRARRCAGDQRLLLWIPALALDLAAPAGRLLAAGPRPRGDDRLRHRGRPLRRALPGASSSSRSASRSWSPARPRRRGPDIDGRALPRSSRSSRPPRCGGCTSARSPSTRAPRSRACDDPGRLARDAYTYLHLPIVAGIIAIAVGDDLLIAEPRHALHGVGAGDGRSAARRSTCSARACSGLRMTGAANAERLAVAALLVLLAPLGAQVSALALSARRRGAVPALAVWELRVRGGQPAVDAAWRPRRRSAHDHVRDRRTSLP